jgi:transketolase
MPEPVDRDPVEAARAALRAPRPTPPRGVVEAMDAGAQGISLGGALLAATPGRLLPDAWCLCRWEDAMGPIWEAIREASADPETGPKILARYDPRHDPPPLGDLAAFGAIARMRVAAPADSESVVAAIAAADPVKDPVYLRIPGGPTPSASDGTFAFGRAPVLREGADLTVVGLGPPLAEARQLAERFHAIGVEIRILDGASVKPLDVPAIVRAARETGALLTVEPHHVLQGLGARVAAVTSTAYPVPVRRVGFPDLPVEGSGSAHPLELGITLAQLEEETWELLRARGKLH